MGAKTETKEILVDNQEFSGSDEFLKVGVHIGTQFRSEIMRPFIYRIRADGLAIMDVQKIAERLEVVAKFLAKYEPHEILVTCRRENGWKAVETFGKLTGVKYITGRYPPGILTNTKLATFTETKIIFVVDPFPDRNSIKDSERMGITVVALCDTNNIGKSIDLILPCNNKGKKSLAFVFLMLAKGFMLEKGLIKKDSDFKYNLEDFYSE